VKTIAERVYGKQLDLTPNSIYTPGDIMEPLQPAHGTRTFFTIWFGQLVSLIGSQLTGFALGVWVYEQTRSVLLLALVQVAQQAPYVLLSPIAGVFADRWNRRTAMIVSDLGAGLAVLAVGGLYLTHHLQIWMVVPINLWMASFNTLMWPSFTASVTLLVPKKQYGRANGFVQLGEALPQIAGPALAGALYVAIHLGNMALLDFATYAFSALLMLFFVRIPNPPRTTQGQDARGSLWKEMRFGWDYIKARKGLLALLLFFLAINFLSGVMNPLIVPLILDNWDASTLGYISTLMGVGMLVGTLVMSAWGGGKRKIFTLLGASTLLGLFLGAVGLRAYLPLLTVCGVAIMFFSPFINACSQAIWQAKVAPDVQGRVFAVRRTIAWSAGLIAPLLAAPLADYIFKPSMAVGGVMAPILGPIFGYGASRGIGVLISLVGLLTTGVTIIAFLTPLIRRVELDLPDYDPASKT
jgi:MFS transporter, DHA3 family, macrolide efflux protein